MTARHTVTDEQLGVLARRQNDLFRRVREGTLPVEQVLDGLQGLIEGRSGYIVDCDAPAWCPDGWSVAPESEQIASRVRGKLALDLGCLALYLDPVQRHGKSIAGTELQTSLVGTPVFTANVLDTYLAHPVLIPVIWKKNGQGDALYIFFWGTIYRDADGNLHVRYLHWTGTEEWTWGNRWLGRGFGTQDPSASLAVGALIS